jgi:hypothetical protein
VMLATPRSEATLGCFNIHLHGQLPSIKTQAARATSFPFFIKGLQHSRTSTMLQGIPGSGFLKTTPCQKRRHLLLVSKRTDCVDASTRFPCA